MPLKKATTTLISALLDPQRPSLRYAPSPRRQRRNRKSRRASADMSANLTSFPLTPVLRGRRLEPEALKSGSAAGLFCGRGRGPPELGEAVKAKPLWEGTSTAADAASARSRDLMMRAAGARIMSISGARRAQTSPGMRAFGGPRWEGLLPGARTRAARQPALWREARNSHFLSGLRKRPKGAHHQHQRGSRKPLKGAWPRSRLLPALPACGRRS